MNKSRSPEKSELLPCRIKIIEQENPVNEMRDGYGSEICGESIADI